MSNESGFKLVDSYVNLQVPITYEIYESFDKGDEVKGVFLDISKAFNKLWNNGIISKLTKNGISRNLLKLLRNFLSERKQSLVLNGQDIWTSANARVFQGSIFSSLLFLIYINNLSEGPFTSAKLFADDASLFFIIHVSQAFTNILNGDLELIRN